MTETEIKEDKYETVNNLLKATNYMTTEEHKIVKQIKDNCHNRYNEYRKKQGNRADYSGRFLKENASGA